MNLHSIKFKVTCWYTGIIVLVFAIVLAGVLLASGYYSEDSIREELLDEVNDLNTEINQFHGNLANQDILLYYDDGVMLSIYREDGAFLNGILPDAFPMDVAFKEEQFQEIKSSGNHWFLLDRKISLEDGSPLWIRGIHSFSFLSHMLTGITIAACILFPLLILATALVGYRMIQRSLRPVSDITNTAREITASSDLSLRLPTPAVKDEFYTLTETFNQMFSHLEEQFHREQQFSSDAAHELRTPLSVMLSHCEYCLAELNLPPEGREELQLIQKKALQMSDLVSQLLAIARAEDGRFLPVFEEVDLVILAETVTEELSEKAGRAQIRLEVVDGMADPCIRGDTRMLMRLLTNLVDNAITYGRPGGYVRLTLSQSGESALISVKDDGAGIPPAALDKIWNRFYRVENSRSSQGFGLGLFLAKHIVASHNGTITVKSTLGKGTAFTVRLPVTQEE